MALSLVLSILSVSACKKEEQNGFYGYISVDTDVDFEIKDSFEYKEMAEVQEGAMELTLNGLEVTLNALYENTHIEMSDEKIIWHKASEESEFVIASILGNKRYISEIDEDTNLWYVQTLKGLGAKIDEIRISVEIEGNTVEMTVEIKAKQTIIDNDTVDAFYEFEYKFNKISNPMEGQE